MVFLSKACQKIFNEKSLFIFNLWMNRKMDGKTDTPTYNSSRPTIKEIPVEIIFHGSIREKLASYSRYS